MCIIVHIPDGVTCPAEDILTECWEANPHGAGFMYADDARLVVNKGFMTLGALLSALSHVPEHVGSLTIHFRIGTHGRLDKANTHPFFIQRGRVGVVHNGILPIDARGDESDTAVFTRRVLAALPPDWYRSYGLRHLVEGYLGDRNKMVVMDRTGHSVILNEHLGEWFEGVWYSNSSYIPCRGFITR